MASSAATSVDQYLAELPPERRAVIASMRELVLRQLPPGYEDVMNWGMISYGGFSTAGDRRPPSAVVVMDDSAASSSRARQVSRTHHPRNMPLPPRDHRLGASATPSILESVARRARSSSDGVLVACAVAGLVGAAAVMVAWPALWPLALPALTVAGFGGWGVADRAASDVANDVTHEAGPSPAAFRMLRAIRLVSGLIGVAALVGFILAAAMRTVLTTGSGWF